MSYLMSFDTQTSVENASVAVDKAKMLIQGLIENKLEPCNGKVFNYCKSDIIMYTDIVYDYICDVADILDDLKSNSSFLHEEVE